MLTQQCLPNCFYNYCFFNFCTIKSTIKNIQNIVKIEFEKIVHMNLI